MTFGQIFVIAFKAIIAIIIIGIGLSIALAGWPILLPLLIFGAVMIAVIESIGGAVIAVIQPIYKMVQPESQQKKAHAKKLHKLAEKGNADAQYELGIMHHKGDILVQDHFKAVNWIRKAAEQGHAEAQYNLGGAYYIGEGVVKDTDKAIEWLQKAAEQGHAEAQKTIHSLNQADGKPIENFKSQQNNEPKTQQTDTPDSDLISEPDIAPTSEPDSEQIANYNKILNK